ncbi:MAG: hypothetical protein J6N76_07005 [Lachnospiraceae bacterium]|nr:hypothetical protein [Lachnospiraceae bacterium]
MATITNLDRISSKERAEREALIAKNEAARRAREEAARIAARRVRIRQGLIFGFALLTFMVVAYSGIVLRDYRFQVTGGQLQLVARIGVQGGGPVSVDNSIPGKLTVTSNQVNGASTYEYQISRFKNMMFGHTYRAESPKKTLAMLSEGKTYYLRVRAYKKNSAGRQVHGAWGTIKTTKVRENNN